MVIDGFESCITKCMENTITSPFMYGFAAYILGMNALIPLHNVLGDMSPRVV